MTAEGRPYGAPAAPNAMPTNATVVIHRGVDAALAQAARVGADAYPDMAAPSIPASPDWTITATSHPRFTLRAEERVRA